MAEPAGRIQQNIINGMKYPDRSLAFVRVDLGGGVPDLTAEEATRRVFGTAMGDNSVKQFYLEVSYGRQDIAGQVVGPLSHSMSGCNTSNLAQTLRPRVDQAAGRSFEHYLWYMGTRAPGCDWSGLAGLGSPTNPARDTWYNASEGCVVLVQEPGHNFGMQHSAALDCSETPFADDPNSCRHEEYGDRYDPMGGGCRHMNVWQKAYQGWFGGCNSVRVGKSGTYTLLPTEIPCDGIQVLQIPMARARPFERPPGGGSRSGTDQMRFFYLELRTRVGFDAPMMNAPTVLVHVADEYRSIQQGGRHTWILDMNPSTTTLDGLGQGQSYTDPAAGSGISFTVQSLSASSATIQVTMPATPPQNFAAENRCLDMSMLSGSGPATCGSGAGGAGGAPSGGAGGAAGAGGRGGATSGGTSGFGGAVSGGASGFGGGGAGAGGVSGFPGTAGFGGATTAGFGPVAGAGGAGMLPVGGTSGAAGFAGGAGVPPTGGAGPVIVPEVDDGCGCRLPAQKGSGTPAGLAVAAAVLASVLRRRRRA